MATSGATHTVTLEDAIINSGDAYIIYNNCVPAATRPTIAAVGYATATGTAAYKLINSTHNFNYQNGLIITNTNSSSPNYNATATITNVDSQAAQTYGGHQVTLSADIMASGDTYTITAPPGTLYDWTKFLDQSIVPGQTVVDLTTGATATVTGFDSSYLMTLSANIFSPGDQYAVLGDWAKLEWAMVEIINPATSY